MKQGYGLARQYKLLYFGLTAKPEPEYTLFYFGLTRNTHSKRSPTTRLQRKQEVRDEYARSTGGAFSAVKVNDAFFALHVRAHGWVVTSG